MSSLSEASKISGQMTVKLFDGKEMTVSTGTTGAGLATQIAPSLGKAAIAVKIDGELRDLSTELQDGERIEIITRDSQDALDLIRHDTAHVMAEAVQLLYPGTQVTIGPSIENGFYYDFHKETPFTPEDLQKIEAKMREIVSADKKFIREEWTREQAVKFFKDKGELFKVELIENLPPSETISIYRQGDWLDLCRGPHLPSTSKVGTAFKLMSVAGAYWRGDSNRPMLQRIYGTAWRDQKELDSYLHMLEEAERRDHRRLGKEMNLFHLQEEAQGSVFWHPKGFTIYRELEAYIRRKIYADGYVEVKTPQLMNSKFWEKSGHWSKFRENMFVVPDIIPNTDEDGPVFKEEPKEFMALKPMNCPAHIQIFKQGIKSYRDLPIRMAEMGCCHRNEAHGALHGLMRVRQMTQDDAHIFCREDQIGEEVKRFVALFKEVYSDFGFTNIKLLLATRPDNRAGDDATWDKAEKAMADALNELDLKFDYAPGEGAFYGPKYEFHLTDSIGRSWQCGTCQLDFVLPERLDASYMGVDGQKYRPVMIHRAVFGTFERFIGLLIESTGGRLPLWLAPVQAVVTTITNESNTYAETVQKALLNAGLRTEIDCRNEKIGYKIREHSLEKIPVLVVVGKKEAETNSVALRYMGDTEQAVLPLEEAIDRLVREAQVPKRK